MERLTQIDQRKLIFSCAKCGIDVYALSNERAGKYRQDFLCKQCRKKDLPRLIRIIIFLYFFIVIYAMFGGFR